MTLGLTSLVRYKKLIGVVVAGVLLTAIFAPFPRASAFTLILDVPTSMTKSAEGTDFTLTLQLEPSEVLSIETVHLVIDDGVSSEKNFEFDAGGLVSGDTELELISGDSSVIDQLSASVDNPARYGYGYAYGYGLVSYGIVGQGYSYSYGYVGNNFYGYSNSYGLTDFVNGFIGPVTITFSGTLQTAALAAGSHTIQASIDTGAASDSEHLISERKSFTVTAGSVDVLVRSELLDGTAVTGLYQQVIEGTGTSPQIASGFTPVLFTEDDDLVNGDTYTVYANDFGQYFFDHWENGAGTNIGTARGETFVAGNDVVLVAVYEEADVDPIVEETEVTDGDDVTTDPIDLPSGGTLTITFDSVLEGGTITVNIYTEDDFDALIDQGILTDVNDDGIPLIDLGGEEGGVISDIVDIDVGDIEFEGEAEVTISYDEDSIELFDPDLDEDDVFITHYISLLEEWEELVGSVDEDLNAASGTTTDFSPFAVAVSEGAAATPGGGGGGGGGSGGTVTITWPRVDTFPPEYFINLPLQRLLVSESAFLDAGGIVITSAEVGQQLTISGKVANHQESSQTYAFIVQVTDENGVVTNIASQHGAIGSGSVVTASTHWTPDAAGKYSIQVFVWDGFSDAPDPLAEVTVKNIAVTE